MSPSAVPPKIQSFNGYGLVRINTLFQHSEKYRHPWELPVIPSFPGFLHELNELSSEIRRIVSRIRTLTDRDRHRCVVNAPEFRIASFVDRSGLLAVSGSVDSLADPDPDASVFS